MKVWILVVIFITSSSVWAASVPKPVKADYLVYHGMAKDNYCFRLSPGNNQGILKAQCDPHLDNGVSHVVVLYNNAGQQLSKINCPRGESFLPLFDLLNKTAK